MNCRTEASPDARISSGAPDAMQLPPDRTCIRSAIAAISSTSWVTTMLVSPSASLSWRMRATSTPAEIGSWPASGSS